MAKSQNGWPVDQTGANQDRNPIYGDVKVPNGVLKGDVAIVLRWVAERFHETVEPLAGGTCWGWYVKSIEGSTSISNHASGTAIDLNADQHPMGVAASKTFTAAQIGACHAIIKACGGVVRWGGDYTGRPDPMHWEIVGTRTQVAALAARIQRGELPMALSDTDKTWLRSTIEDVIEEKFARTQQPNDGGITSRVGRDALDQGVPNPIRGGKGPAWQLLGDIAEAVKS